MKTQRTREYDECIMRECLWLAQKGRGSVSPNPMVGCVLVKNGRIIGQGYHKRFGGPHAEVEAIRSVNGSVKGATAYVNLEPCNYFGKTPPCTDLLIRSGINEVVVGMRDPNPRIAGRGIQQLRRAGIFVKSNVLVDECQRLNESFSKYIVKGLPFVTLKIAQTLDGKIADLTRNSKWITSDASREFVHRLRSEHDAVLVGIGTVFSDDPSLTVRYGSGKSPARVVLDSRFRIDAKARLFRDAGMIPTYVVSLQSSIDRNFQKLRILEQKGAQVIGVSSASPEIPLRKVLRFLAENGLASVLVEGGSRIFSSFISKRLADKIITIIAAKILGNGLDSFGGLPGRSISRPTLLYRTTFHQIDGDMVCEGYLHK